MTMGCYKYSQEEAISNVSTRFGATMMTLFRDDAVQGRLREAERCE